VLGGQVCATWSEGSCSVGIWCLGVARVLSVRVGIVARILVLVVCIGLLCRRRWGSRVRCGNRAGGVWNSARSIRGGRSLEACLGGGEGGWRHNKVGRCTPAMSSRGSGRRVTSRSVGLVSIPITEVTVTSRTIAVAAFPVPTSRSSWSSWSSWSSPLLAAGSFLVKFFAVIPHSLDEVDDEALRLVQDLLRGGADIKVERVVGLLARDSIEIPGPFTAELHPGIGAHLNVPDEGATGADKPGLQNEISVWGNLDGDRLYQERGRVIAGPGGARRFLRLVNHVLDSQHGSVQGFTRARGDVEGEGPFASGVVISGRQVGALDTYESASIPPNLMGRPRILSLHDKRKKKKKKKKK